MHGRYSSNMKEYTFDFYLSFSNLIFPPSTKEGHKEQTFSAVQEV